MISTADLNISERIRVESVEQLSSVLTDANTSDTPVIPIGGGTCLSTGNVVDHNYIGLDLSGLSGVVEYVPTDMTAGFLAGTPIAIVRETLAANGQELPVDLAADDTGTIGGLIATGFAGPRRLSQGTLKDLLIGCEYVRGDGLVAKAGGMTVKNVSGFEISRMLHGSWGSLAVLTRVNLKVLPIARVDQTLSWQDVDMDGAISRQMRLLSRFTGATALQTSRVDGGWLTSVRFSGRSISVDDYVREAVESEGEPVSGDVADLWVAKPVSATEPQIVFSGTVDAVQSAVRQLAGQSTVRDLTWSLGTGTVRATVTLNLDAVVQHLPGPLWMIEGGNQSSKAGVPAWGPDRADLSIMRSIKHQFDPGNVLNRGRLVI